MDHCTWKRVSWQISSIRNSLGQQQGLPFVDLLTPDMLRDMAGPEAESSEPIYTQLVTLWMFLGQVVDSDPSCRQAVARLLAWLTLEGQPACCAETGAYCKARVRLSEDHLHRLVQSTGAELHGKAQNEWLWKGRCVKVADGTTAIMPDNEANQAEYPQPDGQKPGLGFPMVRLVAIFCLATGALLDAAAAAYSGKGTGELSLLRSDLGPVAARRSAAGRSVVLFLVRDGFVAAAWGGCGIAPAPEPPKRLPHGKIVGPARPSRALAEACEARLDGRRDLRFVAGGIGTPRVGSCDPSQRFSRRPPHHHHHVLGRPGISSGGFGRIVLAALAGGTRFSVDQGDDADGGTPLQDAGHGSQGALGPSSRLQPDPWHDCAGVFGTWAETLPNQFQRSDSNPQCISGRPVAFPRHTGDLPTTTDGDRYAPRRRPSWAGGASGKETSQEKLCGTHATSPPSPKAFHENNLKPRKCHWGNALGYRVWPLRALR